MVRGVAEAKMADETQEAELLRRIRAGDAAAFGEYYKSLCSSDDMKKRLRLKQRGVADYVHDSDITQSGFPTSYQRFQEGKFAHVSSREEFIKKLGWIPKHKVIDKRREKTADRRGGGKVKAASSLDKHPGQAPSPQSVVMSEEQVQWVISQLTEPLEQDIVKCMGDCCTLKETQERLGRDHEKVSRHKIKRVHEKVNRLLKRAFSTLFRSQ